MTSLKNIQSASTVLLIRPAHFGFNTETAGSNIFQKNYSESQVEIRKKAVEDFNLFVSLLNQYSIDTIVLEDKMEIITPDSVFPNNWFSTHHDGTVILYPMLSSNRRKERRKEILELFVSKYNFRIGRIIDLTHFEIQNLFLEGTGSLVFDHNNKIAYANLSSRTNKELVEQICNLLRYEPVIFTAQTKEGKEIYHTNVMLAITENFAVICNESIPDESEQEIVLQKLDSTNHEIISISFSQMEQFAGNMLEVRNANSELVTIMSQSAFNCLEKNQHEIILKSSRILPIPIPTIEQIGGGSARCMMAEIFLPVS